MYRNHPYALPPDGYANAVQALDSSALRAWWAQHVNADDAFIAIAGDIATDDAREIAESAFGKLPARSGQPPAKIAIPAPSRAEIVEFRDRKQSAIAVQFPAVLKTSPDYAEVELLRTIASSGAGTLFTELRSKRSLAYTVSLTNRTYAQTGALTAYMATDAAKEETAKSALVAELRRLQKDAITPEHMARAKGYYAGTARLLVESNGARVNEAAVNFFAGVPLDFTTGVLAAVQKLTIDDAKAAAAKYLGGDNYVVAIVRGKP
jgi:zinc protease